MPTGSHNRRTRTNGKWATFNFHRATNSRGSFFSEFADGGKFRNFFFCRRCFVNFGKKLFLCVCVGARDRAFVLLWYRHLELLLFLFFENMILMALWVIREWFLCDVYTASTSPSKLNQWKYFRWDRRFRAISEFLSFLLSLCEYIALNAPKSDEEI